MLVKLIPGDCNAPEVGLSLLTADVTNVRLQSYKVGQQGGIREIWDRISACLLASSVALGKSHPSELQYFGI